MKRQLEEGPTAGLRKAQYASEPHLGGWQLAPYFALAALIVFISIQPFDVIESAAQTVAFAPEIKISLDDLSFAQPIVQFDGRIKAKNPLDAPQNITFHQYYEFFSKSELISKQDLGICTYQLAFQPSSAQSYQISLASMLSPLRTRSVSLILDAIRAPSSVESLEISASFIKKRAAIVMISSRFAMLVSSLISIIMFSIFSPYLTIWHFLLPLFGCLSSNIHTFLMNYSKRTIVMSIFWDCLCLFIVRVASLLSAQSPSYAAAIVFCTLFFIIECVDTYIGTVPPFGIRMPTNKLPALQIAVIIFHIVYLIIIVWICWRSKCVKRRGADFLIIIPTLVSAFIQCVAVRSSEISNYLFNSVIYVPINVLFGLCRFAAFRSISSEYSIVQSHDENSAADGESGK